MRSIQALRESTDPALIKVAGMIRRMTISLTNKVLWQLVGIQLPDGSKETAKAEAFTGIGFYARPPASGSPEAIVASVVDADAQMIIAVRDEKTRAAVVGGLKDGETAMYNDQALVYIKDDGTLEARSASGTAVRIPSLQDLQILRNAIASAVISLGAGGAATINAAMDIAVAALPDPPTPPTWPIGTKKFKAE